MSFPTKGVMFRLVPERKASKLARVKGRPVVAPDVDLEEANRALLAEMEAEWEKDWAEL